MKVAVIQGGPSAEAEVSRASAAGVAAALTKAGHQVTRVELTTELAEHCKQASPDVVFPVTHGRIGEDGCLQGMLELLGLPYVGSGVLACAMAMDKTIAKRCFRAFGLPVAPDVVVRSGTDLQAEAKRVRATIGKAVVVKPPTQGSSIGVVRIDENAPDSELAGALEAALTYDDTVLCEHFVRGREVTCAVLDVPSLGGLRAMPPTEIFSKAADWYDFRSRYGKNGSVHQCPADLPAEVFARVQQIARDAHLSLGCRDLCRVDFVVGDGDDPLAITLLEVNAIPGMTATSLYPEAVAAAGIPFDQLCDAFVRAAVDRSRHQRTVQAFAMPA